MRRAATLQLAEIREVFGLCKQDLADLLGCSASSITEWEHRGIPPERQTSVKRLVDLARTLRTRLTPSRIPEIVRTPDAGLGGRTILQALAQDGVDPIYAYLTALLNYDGAPLVR